MKLEHSGQRRGFSLLEMLAVVAIMGVLMAIAIGAFYRIRGNETVRMTEATLRKINTALDRRWSAVIDKAAEDARTGAIPQDVMSYADDDKERARVIWTYMLLKNEFPTTIAEAKTDITFTGSPLKARAIFVNQLTTAATPELESATCLYISLTQSGNRGETMATDGISIEDFGTARAFTDSWGKPIAFSRMTFAPEVDNSPYLKQNVPSHDPIDPNGYLTTYTTNWTAARCNAFWTAMAQNHLGVVSGTSALIPSTYTTSAAKNWVPSAFSAGANGKTPGTGTIPANHDGYGPTLTGTAFPGGAYANWAPSTPYTPGNTVLNGSTVYVCTGAHTSGATFDPSQASFWSDEGLDNIAGFRLRREGLKGD